MTLASGGRFGPYVVLGPLGSGGMGEVYRARDTRLPRDVALKILLGRAADDPERVRRFQHEARAASSLNHPNIVVVYEAGEVNAEDGQRPVPFLAMELVMGRSLGAVLGAGGLTVRAVLDLITQVADGLARAHESGIVHRDLKPSNILVTPDGLVKIADFGLAKLRPSTPSVLTSRDETETSPGTLLGTPAYMSPEQARGEDVTDASDQFSLGCILYEMLTGQRAFAHASTAETISAVLRDEPTPIAELRPGVPAPLRWMVERCLAKEPRDRYGSTRDLARDLRTLREHLAEVASLAGSEAAPRHWRHSRQMWVVVGCVLVGLSATVFLFLRARMQAAHEPEFRRLTYQEGVVFRALFVPRSSSVLYTASWEGQPPRTFTMLPEASGLDRRLDSVPQLPLAFSEDGSEALVLLGTARPSINAKGTLAVWPSVGGKPRPIVENAGWADWSGGGRLVVFVRDLGAQRVLVRRHEGEERTLFRTVGAISHVRIGPDGSEVAFIHHSSQGDDAGDIRVMRLDGSGVARALTPVFEKCHGLEWNPRKGEIWFTAGRVPHGTSLLAVDRAGHQRTLLVLPEFAVLESVSGSGDRCLLTLRDERLTMAVRRGREAAYDLTWLGMSLVADVSPDGRAVLFWDGGASERSSGIWLRPLDGSDAVRLGEGEPKRFSADGGTVLAVSRPQSGATQFLLIPVGAGAGRSLSPPEINPVSRPSALGPDALLYVRLVGGRKEVWRIRNDGTAAAPLGAEDCDDPIASPSGGSFLAICGASSSALEIHSMTGQGRRQLFELPGQDTFIYARWNGKGDRVFGVTRHRRLLTLDSGSGTVLAEEMLPAVGKAGEDNLLDAAGLSANGSVQAYTARRTTSRLYMAEGIR